MNFSMLNVQCPIPKKRKLGLPRRSALATRFAARRAQTRSIWEQASYVRGQSLFEVVVAIGVAALILVGAMSLSTVSVRNSNFARNDSVATKFAQEGIEWIREERDKSWDTFRSNNSTPKNLGNLSWSSGSCTIAGTTFCRRITAFRCEFYDPGPPVSGPSSIACSNTRANIAYVTVSVSWQDTQGTHSVKTDTIFTRWR